MPRKIDADEARTFLTDRLMNLLGSEGSGVEGMGYDDGWRIRPASSHAFIVTNVEEPTAPKFLVSVEVEN